MTANQKLNQVAGMMTKITGQAPTKQDVILESLAVMLKSGIDVKTAINTIGGLGAWDRVAGMIYDELRAKAS